MSVGVWEASLRVWLSGPVPCVVQGRGGEGWSFTASGRSQEAPFPERCGAPFFKACPPNSASPLPLMRVPSQLPLSTPPLGPVLGPVPARLHTPLGTCVLVTECV